MRDQGDAGGHAVGSGQSLAGRWGPAGGAAGVLLVVRSETLHYMYLWSSDQTPHYMYLLIVRSETTCISGQMEDFRLGCPFGLSLCISGGQVRDTTLHVSLVVRSETLHYMYLWSDGGLQAWLSIWSMSMYLWWSDQRHYTACISGQMEDGRLGCPFVPIASDVFMLLMVAVIALLLSTCLIS